MRAHRVEDQQVTLTPVYLLVVELHRHSAPRTQHYSALMYLLVVELHRHSAPRTQHYSALSTRVVFQYTTVMSITEPGTPKPRIRF